MVRKKQRRQAFLSNNERLVLEVLCKESFALEMRLPPKTKIFQIVA